MTSELLSTLKKTEDSLLRLKRTKKKAEAGDGADPAAASPSGGGGGGTGAMTDENKIRQQLWLDVKQYAAEVRWESVGEPGDGGQVVTGGVVESGAL